MSLNKSKGAFCACGEEKVTKRNLFLKASAQGRLLCHWARTLMVAWGEVVGMSRTGDQGS